ncbi:hypothetical protein EGW08_003941, partial [Elysia chlorotica]
GLDDPTTKKSEEKKPYDFLVKVVLGGTEHVGKTSLLQRFVQNPFKETYIATIGVDFNVKELQTKTGENVKLQIWDLGGQERFRTISVSYYRGARGMLMVYDVTNRKSFDHIEDLLEEVRRYAHEDIVIFIVGNKADHNESKREVSYEEGKQFADYHGLSYVETSARDNVNVNEAFDEFVSQVVEQYKNDRANAAKSGPLRRQPPQPNRELSQLQFATKKKSSTCVIL